MNLQQPNIILITADSLRADRLGCFGYPKAVSPNIDRFALTSSVFSQAFSNGPNTPHAFPAIMAARCSLLSRKLGLFDHPVTIAETLRSAGYHTLAFNAGNPYLARHFHYDRGFDEFTDHINFAAAPTKNRPANAADTCITIPRLNMEHYLVTEENILAKAELEMRFTNEICQRLKTCKNAPFFLWVHYMDTHYPYVPQSEPQTQLNGTVISREENFRFNMAVRENMLLTPDQLEKINQIYDACIHQLDRRIGELLGTLKTLGLFEESSILFCADHGEEFTDHGDLQHKSKLFDELIHVPLVVKKPKQISGEKNTAVVSLLQIAPTILQIAAIDNPFEPSGLFHKPEPGEAFAAASIGSGGGTPVDNHMYETDRLPKVYAYRNNTKKLIIHTNGDKQLFSMVSDPNEAVNIYTATQKEQRTVELRLLEHIRDLEEQRVQASVERSVQKLTGTNEATDGI